MSEYVAFLRAINVAGHSRVKMVDVKKAFTAAGCAAVRTYIQSGNVIFDISESDVDGVFGNVQSRLRSLLNEEPTIIFRRLERLRRVVRASPFKDLRGETTAKFYVTFLSLKPESSPRFPLSAPREGLEVIGMQGLEVFVVSRQKKGGMYGFPNSFIEKRFGVQATSRNWSTVTKIAELPSN